MILERIFTAGGDIRDDLSVRKRVLALMEEHAAATVAMSKAILGAPTKKALTMPGDFLPAMPGRDR